MATITATPPAAPDGEPGWREPPLDRRSAPMVLGGYAALTATLTVAGLLIVWIWQDSRFGSIDAGVNEWLAERRTSTWTEYSDYASMLSDTATMVAASVVLLPLFLWWFRRWHDWTLVVGALVVEVTTFLAVSTLVGRERPPVEQLDGAPTNSFPSGHIAAAVAFYGALAVVVMWHSRNPWVRVPAMALAFIAPLLVTASRLYRGMHYPTDAVGGVVLGVAAVALMRLALERGTRRPLSTVQPEQPATTAPDQLAGTADRSLQTADRG